MGVPSHPYQYLFAGLLLLLAYHRGVLRLPEGPWQWPQIAVNFATLSLFFMIVLEAASVIRLRGSRRPRLPRNRPPTAAPGTGRLCPTIRSSGTAFQASRLEC